MSKAEKWTVTNQSANLPIELLLWLFLHLMRINRFLSISLNKHEILYICMLYLGGCILSGIIMGIINVLCNHEIESYQLIISYPLQFIPLIIFINRYCSKQPETIDEVFPIRHFDKPIVSGVFIFLIFNSLLFVSFFLNSLLPEKPEFICKLSSEEFLWVDILVSVICAPILEEYLHRGLILKGFIEHGATPGHAILYATLIFVAFHFNPWQISTSFLMGLFLGYLFYRTGNLLLPILFHALNNGLAICLNRFYPEAKSITDIIPSNMYIICLIVSFTIIGIVCYKFVSRR